MQAIKINENCYNIEVYDWVVLHDEYICGQVVRKPNENEYEDSDLRYWMFYPSGHTKPLNAGDLRKISYFMAELNMNE